MGSKRVKFENKEDRISDLPDPIIHHILSFLPTTREAVRTGILSKRWLNQWTRVPVLSFVNCGMSLDKFLKFIEYALILHDCAKIKKFRLDYVFAATERDPRFAAKIHFASTKHVEELYLRLPNQELPTFFFNNASLVKLKAAQSTFMPNGKVNWGCLTELIMTCCNFSDQAMEQILSGSPSLKSLELLQSLFGKLVIASKSLEKLALRSLSMSAIDISCPSLLKLSLQFISEVKDTQSLARALENVMSESSLLESFEIFLCFAMFKLSKLVIASKSLKRLVLEEVRISGALEISCPNLEKLIFSRWLKFETAKQLYWPSSVCATIDFYYDWEIDNIRYLNDILHSLKYVKQLELGRWFIRLLSTLAFKGADIFVPVLNAKCLTMDPFHLSNWHYGITRILANSLTLEKLVIKVTETMDFNFDMLQSTENYWNSNVPVFSCLVSHLKTIKIVGFPFNAQSRTLLLNFVKFLLENARVLEKMIVELKDYETTFMLEIFQELLSLPRCSRYSIIEFVCSK